MRGPNVFLGYYKEPGRHRRDADRRLAALGRSRRARRGRLPPITGRKKEIIITAGGKNIAPKNIEAALKQSPLISEAVVIGDRRKYLTALLTLDPEAAASFAAEHRLNGAELHRHPRLRAAIAEHVDEVNAQLARVEAVKKFCILPRNFTIETGELTPTLKVKRKIVARALRAQRSRRCTPTTLRRSPAAEIIAEWCPQRD